MNTDKWKIKYYQTSTGNLPVYTFIEGLDKKAKAKIYYTFTLLEDFGISLGKPHIKKLTGTNLWELRILGSDSIRILYITVTNKTFLLLHSFLKKKMEIDRKDIKLAQARLLDYIARN